MATKKSALGKGLSALLSGADDYNTTTAVQEIKAGSVALVLVEDIEANPFQPRTEFEEQALQELAASIREMGIIQPVTLRKLDKGKYQLISGERRFRASQIAGLIEIPAYVREANDQEMLEMALVENIQREDLNAIEIALSYQRLIDELEFTQEQLSERVAKQRSTITNYLRLLKLPVVIQQGIREGKISMGHARALVSAGDEKVQTKIYYQAVHKGLSVRQVEELVRKHQQEKKQTAAADEHTADDDNKLTKYRLYGDKLSGVLKHPIQIVQDKKGKGKIVIHFESEQDLDKIIEFFDKE